MPKRTVKIDVGLNKAGNQVFEKTKGVDEIKVTQKGDITIPHGYTVKIKFKPAKDCKFTRNAQGKWIEFSKSGAVVEDEGANGIDLEDDNTTGSMNHEIEYELYVNDKTVDPKIINQGSGGGPFARMKKGPKGPGKPAARKRATRKTAARKSTRKK